MDFTPIDFTEQQIKEANALFAKDCSFVLGVAKLEQLPITNIPEVAFAGRSNVGKSSLINAVTNKKGLAKTSIHLDARSNSIILAYKIKFILWICPDTDTLKLLKAW